MISIWGAGASFLLRRGYGRQPKMNATDLFAGTHMEARRFYRSQRKVSSFRYRRRSLMLFPRKRRAPLLHKQCSERKPWRELLEILFVGHIEREDTHLYLSTSFSPVESGSWFAKLR